MIIWLVRLGHRVAAVEKARLEDRAYVLEKIADVKLALVDQTKDIRSTMDQKHVDVTTRISASEKNLMDRIDIFGQLARFGRQLADLQGHVHPD